ncbi:MAG: YIP1 family protein [Bacteroidia bacterium]|nr:YIP1 family protein [Bacteroidia bacterium]
MNYKDLFKIALTLISSPAKAWEEISLEQDKQKVFMTFVYPMIGLCGLSFFIGTLATNGWGGPQSFQMAMQTCCAVAVSLFGGYFLAAYVINLLAVKFFAMPNAPLRTQVFAGYALVVIFLLQIIMGILPSFKIISYFLQLYTVYVVWEGAPLMMRVTEQNRLRLTFVAAFSLMACPWVIQVVFNQLITILS